jgi:hypothetical protein
MKLYNSDKTTKQIIINGNLKEKVWNNLTCSPAFITYEINKT